MPRGRSPNSLKNLNRKGTKPLHGKKKQPTTIALTPEGNKGARKLARSRGMSLSELIERLGRGELSLADPPLDGQRKSSRPH
jgi:hypothetical protein